MRMVLSRVRVTTSKAEAPGSFGEGTQAPPPPRRHSPWLTQHFSALYFRKQMRPDHVTPPRLFTNPLSPCCGPAPKRGPRTRSGAAIFYNCPMEAASVARGGGRASGWSQSCVADGGHARVGRKFLVTADWLTCWSGAGGCSWLPLTSRNPGWLGL